MGIDVYLKWKGQTKAEQEAQFTGFDLCCGNVGYLREAYHGGPYGTKALVPEAWNDDYAGEVVCPAKVLRGRLPRTLETVNRRFRNVYKQDAPAEVLKSFEDFVALAERKEAETGEPCYVIVSA